jgi:DNA-binding NtrC family response regulator
MKVLVLDCDVRVSRALERTLLVLGHEVRCPASAAEARSVLQEDPAVDVILAAQHLEDETGTGFLRWAEAYVPRARRVLISGTHCPPDFVEQPGMQSFQAKPFGRKELEALLVPPHRPPNHADNSPALLPAEETQR